MKFIVDAQLPKSLSNLLCLKGHDSIHTLDLDDKNKTKDNQIISIAASEDRVVITKDSDFLDSFLLSGQPPKLVIVRTGNISNVELIRIFDNLSEQFSLLFIENSLIEINKTEMVVHS